MNAVEVLEFLVGSFEQTWFGLSSNPLHFYPLYWSLKYTFCYSMMVAHVAGEKR